MRYRKIDVLKGILTIQMILAHCLQFFLHLEPGMWQEAISSYINLTTFSGFLFAFGFAAWHAYLAKPFSSVLRRMGRNILRLLAAYYLSAFAFCIWIEGMPLGGRMVRELLTLRRLAGWSEFLLSFAAALLLLLLLHPVARRTGKFFAPGLAAVAVLSCLAPIWVSDPIVATFAGKARFAVFAVVPYSLYLAAGIWFAQGQIGWNKWVCTGAAAGTALFAACHLATGGLPSRFPLSLGWLCGAALFLYLYYLVSGRIQDSRVGYRLQEIGRDSLFYLLLSNLLIFALKSSRFYVLGNAYALSAFVAIVLICRYLRSSVSPPVKAQDVSAAPIEIVK